MPVLAGVVPAPRRRLLRSPEFRVWGLRFKVSDLGSGGLGMYT